MKVLFHVPRQTLRKCFAPADLGRLQVQHQAVFHDDDSADVWLKRWGEDARDVDAVVSGWGTPPITDAMLDAAPALKAIIHSAGSFKALIPASFWSRGLRLATANSALAVGVAETTLGMIIAGLKGFFPCSALTRQGGWDPNVPASGCQVRELVDITVGVIGASAVGRHLIRLLKAFEVNVLVTDPHLSREEAKELGVGKVELDQLMRASDIVCLHAPALAETRRMLRREHFAMMKDGGIFINTARGMIVDEPGLVAELERGRIFAFIDVTDPEPPAVDHPFRRLPNVVLTPHIAGAVSNGCLRQGRLAVRQLLALAAGDPMPGEVTAERAAIMA